jgi:heterodisulfide reductase subunit C
MSITDLTSMAEAQAAERQEINERLLKLKDEVSDYCFQCAKCTSGCEAHKLLELEPHKIVALLKRGLIDEMLNSEIIWTCMSCFKCKERCPQKVAPVNILFTLKNLAVASGKQVPGDYTAMLQSVMGMGLMQDVQTVTTRSGETRKRSDLDLSPCSKPKEPAKFQATVMTVAMEKV